MIVGCQVAEYADQLYSINGQLSHVRKQVRSRVIVQFSVIEALLGKILTLHFITGEEEHLLRSDGPLGPVKSRARICFALGLINKLEFDDIDKYAKIRNSLAHRFDVSSSASDPEVRKWVLETTFYKNLPKDNSFNDDMSLVGGIFMLTMVLKTRLSQVRRCKVLQEPFPITWNNEY